MPRTWTEDGQTVTEHDLKCPECGGKMVLRKTTKLRWAKNGRGRLFYGCEKWPACTGTHGAHPNGKPLGVPGHRATKAARSAAHLAFDTLVETRNWSKGAGYRWLAEKLDIPKGEVRERCHIACFDIETCAKVVEICMQEGRKELV